MRARYYNVEIKRFINQDVLLGVLERISSLNRYAYVEGNPISYLDPFGLEAFDTTAIHDILTVISTVVSIASFVFPGDLLMTSLSVALNIADIVVYIYDMKQAIDESNFDKLDDALKGIAVNIISAMTVIVGFNIESFYEKIIGFKGWSNTNAFVRKTEKTIGVGRKVVNKTSESLITYTIVNFLKKHFNIDY